MTTPADTAPDAARISVCRGRSDTSAPHTPAREDVASVNADPAVMPRSRVLWNSYTGENRGLPCGTQRARDVSTAACGYHPWARLAHRGVVPAAESRIICDARAMGVSGRVPDCAAARLRTRLGGPDHVGLISCATASDAYSRQEIPSKRVTPKQGVA